MDKPDHSQKLMVILSYLGGGLVFIGLMIYIAQNWLILSAPQRLVLTLGESIATYIVGLLLTRDSKVLAGNCFFLISGLTLPIGLYVLADYLHQNPFTPEMQALLSFVAFFVFTLSTLLYRSIIFTLFQIIFGSWFYGSLGEYLHVHHYIVPSHFYDYQMMILGLSYLLIGRYLFFTKQAALTTWLYSFGCLFILISAWSLCGFFFTKAHLGWQLLYPVITLGLLLLSIPYQSRAFLVFGTLFLIFYILEITNLYFAHSLGWPLALVIAGLLLILVGFIVLNVKKKYF